MSRLFSPLNLGPLKLVNRIVVAPMCQYSADNGKATDWHCMHLGNLSLSGAGFMIIEATAVEARGRITYADLGLWDDACESALAGVLASVRKYSDMPIGIQLAHAGRKGSTQRPRPCRFPPRPATDPLQRSAPPRRTILRSLPRECLPQDLEA